MAIPAPSHLPLPRITLSEAAGEAFSHLSSDDDFLYHVTSAARVEEILGNGLTPNAPFTIQGGAYQNYSRGKLFLTERSGVDYWKHRIEQHLFHAHDDPPEVAVIRVPRALVGRLQPDELGTRDSDRLAYYTESPIPPNLDEHIVAFHGTRVMPEFTQFSCDGPPIDDDGEALSSGSGPDVTAYMGAHFAKEAAVARKFATGVGWMKTRFDGDKTRPRVLQVALDLKNPVEFMDEDDLRDLAYRHSISDENTLEPALRLEGIDLHTALADAWFEKYDDSEDKRVETNRWLIERHRPGEGEEDGLRDAARELAAAAVADLRKEGYDGIIYRNQVEGGTGLVVFGPEQAKIIAVEYLKGKYQEKPGEESLLAKLMSGQAKLTPPEPTAKEKSRFTVEQAKALTEMVTDASLG